MITYWLKNNIFILYLKITYFFIANPIASFSANSASLFFITLANPDLSNQNAGKGLWACNAVFRGTLKVLARKEARGG